MLSNLNRRRRRDSERHLNIVSANVRGFPTNVGEHTHRFVRRNDADIVFVCEPFLDSGVPSNYVRIKGYSKWVRKDRSSHGGGVAFCYKTLLNVVILDTPIPPWFEILMIKIINKDGHGTLCIGCYRSLSQGAAVMDFLNENLDHLITTHRCDSVIILGDLNRVGYSEPSTPSWPCLT